MPIKRQSGTVRQAGAAYKKKAVEAVINTFAYIGETCITESRNNGKYVDRTGNLRSSIGYAVIYEGKAVRKGGNTNGTDEGRDSAQTFSVELIDKVQSYFPGGITLIVVAGMNYATYVEAMGLNVLASSKLLAEKLVPEMMEKLGFEVK
jgi:hypothetical protein